MILLRPVVCSSPCIWLTRSHAYFMRLKNRTHPARFISILIPPPMVYLSGECLFWRCFICFTCCFLSIILRGRSQIRRKRKRQHLNAQVFCHVNGIETRASFMHQPSNVLFYLCGTKTPFYDIFPKVSLISNGFLFMKRPPPIIKQKMKAAARMQIEFVQSSIKTVCLSSPPPVCPRSPSVELESCVANFSSGAWMTMSVMSRCTYRGHRTQAIKLNRKLLTAGRNSSCSLKPRVQCTMGGLKKTGNIDAKGSDTRNLRGENPPKTVEKFVWVCVLVLHACLITDVHIAALVDVYVSVAPASRAKIPRKWESELIKLLLQFAQLLSNGLTAN